MRCRIVQKTVPVGNLGGGKVIYSPPIHILIPGIPRQVIELIGVDGVPYPGDIGNILLFKNRIYVKPDINEIGGRYIRIVVYPAVSVPELISRAKIHRAVYRLYALGNVDDAIIQRTIQYLGNRYIGVSGH